MLTSLAIHAIPMTLLFHIRWITIPAQADLPKEQQRFSAGALTEDSIGGFLYQ